MDVHDRGMALIIGELGINVGLDAPPYYLTIRNGLEVAGEKGIGWLTWARDGGDANKLCNGPIQGGAWEID